MMDELSSVLPKPIACPGAARWRVALSAKPTTEEGLTPPSRGFLGALCIQCALLVLSGLATPALGQLRTIVLSKDQVVPTIIVVVGPNGVYPSAITRPQGPMFVRIENRSRSGKVTLRLKKSGDSKELVRSYHTKTHWDSTFLVDMEPGVYRWTADEDPKWALTITITN